VRIGLGRTTRAEDVEAAADALVAEVRRLRDARGAVARGAAGGPLP
jgi:hypothetical protein